MSHHFTSGICVRTPSWHGRELLLADYPDSWEHARSLAGIEWEPAEVQMGLTSSTDLDGRPVYRPVTSHKAIVRSDTGYHLGTVGADWHPITHATMGEVVESLLGESNVNIDTMVSLKGGRQIAVTIELDEPYVTAGDDSPTLPYLVLLNAHDGSSAFRAMATQVRVVCANTYAAATMDGNRTGRQFTFRHTAKVMDRIEDAKAAIAGVRDDAAEWRDLAGQLGLLVAGPDSLDRFLSEFIPAPPDGIVSDRVLANVSEARSTFRGYYASSTCEGSAGTALGLVHAAVEYLDHARGHRNADTLMGRQLLRPEPLKTRAVKLAREVCSA